MLLFQKITFFLTKPVFRVKDFFIDYTGDYTNAFWSKQGPRQVFLIFQVLLLLRKKIQTFRAFNAELGCLDNICGLFLSANPNHKWSILTLSKS